jgi:hypothetical protein
MPGALVQQIDGVPVVLVCWWFLPPLITSVLSEPALLLWGLCWVVSVRLPWPSVGRNLGTVGWRVDRGVVV